MTIRTLLIALLAFSGTIWAQSSGRVGTCQYSGKSSADAQIAKSYCEIYKDNEGIKAFQVMETLLWIDVTKPFAQAMRLDELQTKQLVLNWMTMHKAKVDSKAVNVMVKWGDVDIAEGKTSIFSGDYVTIY